ncbi:MAG TPA: glycosyltransferase [Gaiellaceae bacterium]|nr:glycosyltransferase [Gaiellaceae bacterium]
MTVALVHDYLTQRGGAERVVLSLLRAFPGAPLHTSLYEPEATFPEFADAEIRTTPLDRVALLRRHHRLALPLLAPAFDRLRVEADVVVCSSSGWAHGARVSGRKVVYCHTPARWLYQTERYLGEDRGRSRRAALALLRRRLRRWDAAAARSADRYVVNSSVVRERVRELYGIEAETVPPPPAVVPGGEEHALPGLEPGFVLCVSRLLPYKNVDAVLAAFADLPGERLVVAGGGPELERLRRAAPKNATLVGRVADAELRWLYANAAGLVAASYEDFGLTPLEAASFGRPCAALRFGGFLDTIVEGETGVLFREPTPAEIRTAVERLLRQPWNEARLRAHADGFVEARFVAEMRRIVLDPRPRVEVESL